MKESTLPQAPTILKTGETPTLPAYIMNAFMKQTDFALLLGSVLSVAFVIPGLLNTSSAEPRETPGKTKAAKPPFDAAGQKVFEMRCAACHGLNGRGGEHAPDIVANPNLSSASDQTFFQIIRDGIPRRGMPGFNLILTRAQIRAVVGYLRAEAYSQDDAGNEKRDDIGTSGNPKRGEELFFGRAGCGGCHTINGRGGFLGMDLSSYGRDHSPAKIRDAILNPNRKLSPKRQVVVVTTRDGRQLLGMARNEDNFSLQLLDPDGNFHFLVKSGLADLRREPRSLMPDDYASRLCATELEDVVRYLVNHGRAKQ